METSPLTPKFKPKKWSDKLVERANVILQVKRSNKLKRFGKVAIDEEKELTKEDLLRQQLAQIPCNHTLETIGPPPKQDDWKSHWGSQSLCSFCNKPAINDVVICQKCDVIHHILCLRLYLTMRLKPRSSFVVDDNDCLSINSSLDDLQSIDSHDNEFYDSYSPNNSTSSRLANSPKTNRTRKTSVKSVRGNFVNKLKTRKNKYNFEMSYDTVDSTVTLSTMNLEQIRNNFTCPKCEESFQLDYQYYERMVNKLKENKKKDLCARLITVRFIIYVEQCRLKARIRAIVKIQSALRCYLAKYKYRLKARSMLRTLIFRMEKLPVRIMQQGLIILTIVESYRSIQIFRIDKTAGKILITTKYLYVVSTLTCRGLTSRGFPYPWCNWTHDCLYNCSSQDRV